MRAWIGAAALVVGVSGCVTQATGAAKAQETAQEMNLNTRFGRMELAMEHVAAKDRDAFVQRHKGWGGAVRIADAELSGLRPITKEQANVFVRVAWYRADEQELRLTTVRQIWRDHKGDWLLEAEERVEGDIGLLGEPVLQVAPPPREHAQFPTVRLGD